MQDAQQPSETQYVAQQPKSSGNNIGVPIAIVIAALLIAGAIYLRPGGTPPSQVVTTTEPPAQEQVTPEVEVAPVTAEDHIRGNPNAPIMIVEYSDFDCPFCKNFHETLNQIMETYGADGQVAWVYRHFPIVQLHPNAPKVAEASECVAGLGGNDAFWAFADLVFGERGVNEPTDMTRLGEFARRAGVSETAFNDCLQNGTYTEKITEAVDAAVKAGARGTPHSFLIVGDQRGVINGAQRYEIISQNIEAILKLLEQNEEGA